MLVHQIQASSATSGSPASGSNSIKLSDRDVFRLGIFGTVHSGIQLNTSGVLNLVQLNGGFSAITGEWLVVGSSSTFYVQRTIISGTLETDPGSGFLQLSSSRLYINENASIGSKVTVVFFELADSAAGTNILASATMTFTSEVESGA